MICGFNICLTQPASTGNGAKFRNYTKLITRCDASSELIGLQCLQRRRRVAALFSRVENYSSAPARCCNFSKVGRKTIRDHKFLFPPIAPRGHFYSDFGKSHFPEPGRNFTTSLQGTPPSSTSVLTSHQLLESKSRTPLRESSNTLTESSVPLGHPPHSQAKRPRRPYHDQRSCFTMKI